MSRYSDFDMALTHFHQAVETIPPVLHNLAKVPSDDETWLGYLIPVNQLESNASLWGIARYFPSIHIVGKINDDFCLVAVASCTQRHLRELKSQNFSFKLASDEGVFASVMELCEAEKGVQGIHTMRQKFQRCIIRNAIRGVTSAGCRGLVRYYWKIIHDKRLLVPIEWACLNHDISISPSKTRDLFFLSCLCLSLHLLDDLDGLAAFELVKRLPDAWMDRFRELEREKLVGQVGNVDAELHQVSLIRAAYSDSPAMKQVFVTSNLGTKGQPTKTLKRSATSSTSSSPSQRQSGSAQGRQVYMTLPANLINRLEYREVITALGVIGDTYEQLPGLEKKKNDLLLLLYYFAKRPVDHKVLAQWMASEQGQLTYRGIVTNVRESQTGEQFLLGLAVLGIYGLVLDIPPVS
ncbi:hypothetical protein NM208_g3361 [Fusarium decemcellulare]|uniref:Uncharacterized protein n=2 Tax=Fusarium decemcellulare TaxID=57161 RepID=A0ACC1SPP0_9HYPO|nr:hypothetical protein NM208_g6189 [Fusarium decemcellulare]KAJ3543845.1 hypothetical protein NM208_g3361 [Fusarium decemcellulare]